MTSILNLISTRQIKQILENPFKATNLDTNSTSFICTNIYMYEIHSVNVSM